MCADSIKIHSFSVSCTITQRNIIIVYLGSIVNSILVPPASPLAPAESIPTKTELLQRFLKFTKNLSGKTNWLVAHHSVKWSKPCFQNGIFYKVLYTDIFVSQNCQFTASFFEWWIRAKHELGIPKRNLLINVYPGPW